MNKKSLTIWSVIYLYYFGKQICDFNIGDYHHFIKGKNLHFNEFRKGGE